MTSLYQAGHGQPAADQGPELEPLYFGASRELFGCLHFPQGTPRASRGVVICPAAGPEYARCHRPLRVLAALLARNGWPVLRFDYFATGDSYGDAEEATLSRWQDDVADAVRFLRGRFRATRLTLLGVRIGAALAARHTMARGGIERLVLWDPVVRGRDFVDGLRAQTADHERWLVEKHGQRPASIEADGPRDLFGYRYSDAILDALASLDLMVESGRGGADTLILDNGEDAAMDGLAAHLRAAGMTVDLERLPDRRVWMTEPFQGLLSTRSLKLLVGWISGEGS
jgi:pimeloyl-ACP methyl ester carboxylesterase